jgi:hypothetical protein
VAASVETRVSVNADLLRFTQSNVSFDATATVTIHEFMALQFSATSSNGQVYVYFPPLAERVGREPRNVVTDLVRSFNVFSDQDRRTSGFKLQRLEIGVLHDLGDWDLSVLYTARPALQTSGPDAGLYTIDRSLEINLSWRAIDELSASASVDEDEFTIGGDS